MLPVYQSRQTTLHTNLFVNDSNRNPHLAISGSFWVTDSSLTSHCSQGLVPKSPLQLCITGPASEGQVFPKENITCFHQTRMGTGLDKSHPGPLHILPPFLVLNQAVVSFPVFQTPPFLASPLSNKQQRQRKSTKYTYKRLKNLGCKRAQRMSE